MKVQLGEKIKNYNDKIALILIKKGVVTEVGATTTKGKGKTTKGKK